MTGQGDDLQAASPIHLPACNRIAVCGYGQRVSAVTLPQARTPTGRDIDR